MSIREYWRIWFPKPEPAKPIEQSEPENPEWWADWQTILAAYPVGRRFNYLGRDMVVTLRRTHYTSYQSITGPYFPGREPAIIAEYADNNGVIHEHAFEKAQWAILLEVAP